MLLNLTVDRFEDSNAILKTPENKTIIWPKDKIPKETKEGTVLSFSISANTNKEQDKRQLAKDILNEILNPEDSHDL